MNKSLLNYITGRYVLQYTDGSEIQDVPGVGYTSSAQVSNVYTFIQYTMDSLDRTKTLFTLAQRRTTQS